MNKFMCKYTKKLKERFFQTFFSLCVTSNENPYLFPTIKKVTESQSHKVTKAERYKND